MGELGVAGTIRVKFFYGGIANVQHKVNEWLEENADLEILDIQYQPISSKDGDFDNVMIIYRKE